MNGENIEAMVYIMNTKDECPPTLHYYNILKDGYEAFGFDKEILEKALIESWEKKNEYVS